MFHPDLQRNIVVLDSFSTDLDSKKPDAEPTPPVNEESNVICKFCDKSGNVVPYLTLRKVQFRLGDTVKKIDECSLVLCESCGSVTGSDDSIDEVACAILDIRVYSCVSRHVREEIAALVIEKAYLESLDTDNIY